MKGAGLPAPWTSQPGCGLGEDSQPADPTLGVGVAPSGLASYPLHMNLHSIGPGKFSFLRDVFSWSFFLVSCNSLIIKTHLTCTECSRVCILIIIQMNIAREPGARCKACAPSPCLFVQRRSHRSGNGRNSRCLEVILAVSYSVRHEGH